MILEADRIVADWLAGPNGVTAQLAVIPLDAGDSAPVAIATVADETRDGMAARNEPAQPYPSVTVSVDALTDLDGVAQVVTADGDMKVRVRIAVDSNVTENAVRDVSYYLRATIKSLRLLCADAHSASRIRNSVFLETVLAMVEAIDFPKPDQAATTVISGYVILTMRLRDQAP